MQDSFGNNSTFDWFRLLQEQEQKKLAIIAGDSQVGHSGKALETLLVNNGYDVLRKYKGTWRESENTNVTIARINGINPNRPVSLVVVFTGGNNPNARFTEESITKLIKTIKKKFGPKVEIVIGAVPPARTGDPKEVRKIFGRSSHSENLKRKRKEVAAATVAAASALGVLAVNPNNFLDPDTNVGDGIHLTGNDASNFASKIFDKVSGKQNVKMPVTTSPKNVVNKIKQLSKKKRISFLDALMDLAYGSQDPRNFFKTMGIAALAATLARKSTKKSQTATQTTQVDQNYASSGYVMKGISADQKKVADMIFAKYKAAGLSPSIAAAAVVNGIKESGLKYYLVGDGGNSVGLFQLHRGSYKRPYWTKVGLDKDVSLVTKRKFRKLCRSQNLSPGGYKCSVKALGMKEFAKERLKEGDWRFDPERNTQAIIDIEVKGYFGRRLLAADARGAKIPELAAIFSRDIERPAAKEKNMRIRRQKALSMFGNVRLEEKNKAVAE